MFSAHVYFNILSKNASCFAIKKINKKIDRKKKLSVRKILFIIETLEGKNFHAKFNSLIFFQRIKSEQTTLGSQGIWSA